MTPALEPAVRRAELLHAREVELAAKAKAAKDWWEARRYYVRYQATRQARLRLLRRIGVR